MALGWLKSPLVCEGRIVRPGLLPESISDADLPDICLRMHLVLDTIEFERCEGRQINLNIFDPIDSMESQLRHGQDNHLCDWQETITRFANYYKLDGSNPIRITLRAIDGCSHIAEHHGILLVDDG
jgi:hypothetical protein